MSATRLYKVDCKSTGGFRLVEAVTPRGAIAHAAATEFTARRPQNHELFNLGRSGVETEIAGSEPASDETRAALAQSVIEG